MNTMLADESRLHQHEFNINAALYELYHYVVRYNDEVCQVLIIYLNYLFHLALFLL